jgi:hypothetical protein
MRRTSAALKTSRLLINQSLFPLFSLPRKTAGEKIRKEAIFTQGVKSERKR